MSEAGKLTRFELHGMQPVLAVADVRASVVFYCDVLGFHEDFVEGDPPVHARVVADPTYSSPTVHIRFEPLPAGSRSNPSVYLWIHVARDLDELFARFERLGAEILEKPVDKPWGLRHFSIRDPDGYELTFCAELCAV